MSDYSKITFEKVDDLPSQYFHMARVSKPLSPSNIFVTLPFLKDLPVNEAVKFPMPEDGFDYRLVETEPKGSGAYYASTKSAFQRTFDVLAKEMNLHYVFRYLDGFCYVKRVEN